MTKPFIMAILTNISTQSKTKMKAKFAIFMLLCLGIISCQNVEQGDLVDNVQAKATTTNLNIRSIDEIIDIANSAVEILDDAQTRNINRFASSTANALPLYSANSRSDAESPAIYVVNYDNEEGFAIISTNKAIEPVLAVSETGIYTPDNETNTGLDDFINLALKYVEFASNQNTTMSRGEDFDTQFDTTTSYTNPIRSNLSTSWGQNDIYGAKCPNGLSGCFNTALAQILCNIKYPTTLSITYPNADITTLNLDWSDISKHSIIATTSSNALIINNCMASDDAHEAISYLMRELGYRSNSIYNSKPKSTGTLPDLGYSCAKGLGLTMSSITNYTTGCEKDALSTNRLMLTFGYQQLTDSTLTGHAWVVDNHKEKIVTTKYYYEDGVKLSTPKTVSTVTNYAHVNWGWNSNGNGYYISNVFNTEEPYQLDFNSKQASSYYFDYNVNYFTIQE
jgi:hypothetical protein